MSESLEVQVKLLEPAAGDVLVVKAETVTGELIRKVHDAAPPGVAVLLMSVKESVELMDEDSMRRAGWVRAGAGEPSRV